MTPTSRSRAYGSRAQTFSSDYFGAVAGDGFPYLYREGHGLEFQGSQTTTSDNHPGWRSALGADLNDVGGDFSTSYSKIDSPLAVYDNIHYGDLVSPFHKWKGTIIPDVFVYGKDLNPSSYHPGSWPNPSDLAELGTTAIAACEPTRSVADLSTGLGEIVKDGLPSIPLIRSFKKRAKIAADAGDQFLNASFGWLPLVKDVTNVSRFAVEHDKLIAQFERDSGRPVRRRFRFPDKVSTELIDTRPATLVMGQGNEISQLDGSVGELLWYRSITQKTWFSGSFTYYLPSSIEGREGLSDAASSAKQLLGVELNPEVLWNLAPWSWAVDWFTNAGDYAHNISAFADNGLVMHYGYIMQNTKITDVFSHMGPTGLITSRGQRSLSFTNESKIRHAASPYGFGISYGGLSDFQKSVLVALGIRRR